MKSNNLHYVKVESCRNILLASACLSRGQTPNGNERGFGTAFIKLTKLWRVLEWPTSGSG